MALGDPYASTLDLELRLGQSNDGTFSALLNAASRAVERFCQRQFNTDNVATAREYEPADVQFLAVDDFHTTQDLAIVVDGDLVDLADVSLRPRNGIIDGQSGWPFFQIFAKRCLWPVLFWHTPWPLDPPIVTVTAQWGWAAVPEGIVQATLDVASAMALGIGTNENLAIVQSQTVEGFSETYQVPGLGATQAGVPKVFAKALPYRRKKYGVA